MPSSPKDRPDVRVLTEIAIIEQLSRVKLERRLPSGMSAAQFAVLTHFMRRGGEESPAQLASAFQVTKGAVTNTLQRLKARGLVRIRGDEHDGRRKLVGLTPAGVAAYDAAIEAMRPDLEAMRAAFTEAEFLAALPFLTALSAWFDETR